MAEHHPKAGVDDQLHEQESADPLAGVVHRLGHHGEPAVAHQPDQAIAQVLALQQHEHDQYQGQGQAAERLHQRD